MKILFDARYIKPTGLDGIGRFTQNLGSALYDLTLQEGSTVDYLVCDDKQRSFLPSGATCHDFHDPTSVSEPLSALKLNKLDFDVFFSPMQTVGLRGKKFPAVLTVHDLIYYSHPKPPRDLPAYVRGLWRAYHKAYFPQRFLLNSADAIATVSETTKQLIENNKLTTKPVQVVYNGVEQDSKPAVPGRQRNKELVYMGSFMPYKNVETLVQAINLLPDYKLRLLSRINTKTKKHLLSLATRPEQLVFDEGVTDGEYQSILGSAFAAVNASRDEGFGIPLIEAMSLGTPVICSDIPIFHEVAKNAAIYASPDRPEEFAAAIHLIEKSKSWENQSRKGIVRSKKFTWKSSAQELYTLLKSVV